MGRVLHPRDAFHACHECRRFAPAARLSVKRLLFAVFPSCQCEFACPVSSFLVGDTVSSGGDVLVQNMDFSCCLARGGIEPPLIA